jgi:hypothetical protein
MGTTDGKLVGPLTFKVILGEEFLYEPSIVNILRSYAYRKPIKFDHNYQRILISREILCIHELEESVLLK